MVPQNTVDPPSPPSEATGATSPSARRDAGTVVAIVLSSLALGASIYQGIQMRVQNSLMLAQAKTSVWPYVLVTEQDDPTPGKQQFSWRLENNGVGPARIESVVVQLDGKTYRNWSDIVAQLVPERDVHFARHSVNGSLLPPSLNRDTAVDMIDLSDPQAAKVLYDAKDRFRFDVCYCSIYDDCWIAQWKGPKAARPVARCQRNESLEFAA